MRLRLPLMAVTAMLAACAAVTGLGDYDVVGEPRGDEGGTSGVGPGDGGTLVLQDGNVVVSRPTRLECATGVSCDKTCCFDINGEGDSGCVERCAQPVPAQLAFTCDDPGDCLTNEICCVQVYAVEYPVQGAASTLSMPFGARCTVRSECRVDVGSLAEAGADPAEAEELSKLMKVYEACDQNGRCPNGGSCVGFPPDASLLAFLGGGEREVMPKLGYCRP